MAMSVYYTTVAGEIVSENRNGVESFYTPDTNGNTMRLRDVNGNVTDEWTYWPYGEVRTRTGTTPTPFTFGGVVGYYAEQLSNKFYTRARYLQAFLARWLTADPLWPQESAYGYCSCSPCAYSDASGCKCTTDGILKSEDKDACKKYCYVRGLSLEKCTCREIILPRWGWPPYSTTFQLIVLCSSPWNVTPYDTCFNLCMAGCTVSKVADDPTCTKGCELLCGLIGHFNQ
jgi:RHS repeat-associated protein